MRAMSFRDYLHEMTEESRHNELTAYLMFLAGVMFFVGGILESLSLAENPEWFIFIPYHAESIAGAALGLSLIVSGLSLIVYGIVAGVRYSRKRVWLMQEIRKATRLEEEAFMRKRPGKKSR